MFEIDRTVIGSERRRWHPVNPFEMKRHGQTRYLPAGSIPDSGRFGQPITEMVNGTFGGLRRKFALFLTDKLPQSAVPPRILSVFKALSHKAVNDD